MKSLLKPCDCVNDSRAQWVLGFLAVFLSQAVPAFAQSVSPLSPTNIFAPVSTPADSIFGLSVFVLEVTAAIFAVVFSLLLYSILKFKKKKDDDGREPPQVYGSNQVELAWTVIPVLIVVGHLLSSTLGHFRPQPIVAPKYSHFNSLF